MSSHSTHFLSSLLLLLLLLLLSTSSLPASSTHCNKSDKKTLLSIKSALGNPYVIITWGQTGQTTNCCNWVGVDCNPSGRVTGVDISGDTVSGHIPSSIGDLPFLTSLTFHKLANLTGPIPFAITKLTKLNSLSLDWNDLSGPIPPFLSKLTSLTYLNLAFNHFTGSIPSTLANLPLTYIGLDRNHLTGPIPDSLGAQPQFLYLSHNNLTGPIPESFAQIGFVVIDLSRNKLTGDASILFGKSKPLQRSDLSRNLFEFDLTEVELPTEMNAIDLSHNKIYGRIPKVFTERGWQSLNVSYNRLCGEIPSDIGRVGEFDAYTFFHNKCLCGPPLSPCK